MAIYTMFSISWPHSLQDDHACQPSTLGSGCVTTRSKDVQASQRTLSLNLGSQAGVACDNSLYSSAHAAAAAIQHCQACRALSMFVCLHADFFFDLPQLVRMAMIGLRTLVKGCSGMQATASASDCQPVRYSTS